MMGTAYELKCKECTYNSKVYLGIGFSYYKLENILPFVKNMEARKRIEPFISNNDAKHQCYEALFVCRKCHYILNDLYWEIHSNDDAYLLEHTCPRCTEKISTEPISNIAEDSTVILCPTCVHSKLDIHAYMDWD